MFELNGKKLGEVKFFEMSSGAQDLCARDWRWSVHEVDGPEAWGMAGFATKEIAEADFSWWLRRMGHEDTKPSAPGKINPKIIIRDCIAACSELAGVSNLPDVITAVVDGAGGTLNEIEKEIEEAGSMTSNTAAVLMGVGAVFEVAKQLPATRGKLVEAGRVVGRMMARRYRAKITEAISRKDGGN